MNGEYSLIRRPGTLYNPDYTQKQQDIGNNYVHHVEVYIYL